MVAPLPPPPQTHKLSIVYWLILTNPTHGEFTLRWKRWGFSIPVLFLRTMMNGKLQVFHSNMVMFYKNQGKTCSKDKNYLKWPSIPLFHTPNPAWTSSVMWRVPLPSASITCYSSSQRHPSCGSFRKYIYITIYIYTYMSMSIFVFLSVGHMCSRYMIHMSHVYK